MRLHAQLIQVFQGPIHEDPKVFPLACILAKAALSSQLFYSVYEMKFSQNEIKLWKFLQTLLYVHCVLSVWNWKALNFIPKVAYVQHFCQQQPGTNNTVPTEKANILYIQKGTSRKLKTIPQSLARHTCDQLFGLLLQISRQQTCFKITAKASKGWKICRNR